MKGPCWVTNEHEDLCEIIDNCGRCPVYKFKKHVKIFDTETMAKPKA